MSDYVRILNADSFDVEIAATEKLVLIDFYADWCAPCKQIAPMIEEIAEAYLDDIFVCKVNADDSPDIAKRFGVRGLPTLLLLKNGNEAERSFVVSKTRLAEMIETHLS